MRPNLKSLARADAKVARLNAAPPSGVAPSAQPDPALLWFFDSSKQLLVFRDTGSGGAAAWSEDMLTRSGWNMFGIRTLPRVSVQGP